METEFPLIDEDVIFTIKGWINLYFEIQSIVFIGIMRRSSNDLS
jgi:hypothetical protein